MAIQSTTALTLLVCLVGLVSASKWLQRPRHFDDYLSTLNLREQAKITGDEKEFEGSGDIDEPIEDPDYGWNEYSSKRKLPIRTGLKYSKDVACCSLGQLAGDKGYHCHVKFYAARIIMRNKNRAHNRKMGFYGQYKVPNYGTKLMRTFEQCVAGRGMVFNKCCHLAAVEIKMRPRFDTIQRKRYQLKRQWRKAKLLNREETGV